MNEVLLAVGCTLLGMSMGIVVGFFCGEAEGIAEGLREGLLHESKIIVLRKAGKK